MKQLYRCIAIFLLFVSFQVSAQEIPEISAENPVEIEADEVDYLYDDNVVVARGDVIIRFAGNILKTEEMEYNRNTKIITINGHMYLVDADGNEYNAKSALVNSEWVNSAFSGATLVFKKEGIIYADKLIVTKRDIIEASDIKYTMCDLCNNDFAGIPPLWSIEGKYIKRDNEKQVITARHSFVKVIGVPVFYLPYITFPTPGAESKTGFLAPIIRHDSDFGVNVKLPLYVRLAPNADLVVKPWITSHFGNQISIEFNHLLRHGKHRLIMSGARTDYVKDNGALNKSDSKNRAHINAVGEFDTTQLGRSGIFGYDIMRVDDPFKTYLKKYDISDKDILNSKIYYNHFKQDEHFTAEALQFQGLRVRDSFKITPQAYPRLEYFKTRDIGENLVWNYDLHFLNLYRSQGRNVRRIGLSTKVLGRKYQDQYNFSYFASLKADYYNSDVNNPNGNALTKYNQELGIITDRKKIVDLRVFPKIGAELKMPFYSRDHNKRFVFEPRASIIISPKLQPDKQQINEDSQSPELQINNLFLDNIYKGRDRIQDGTSLNYGFRTIYSQNQYRLLFEFGQLYSFANNSDFGTQSGLSKNFSDYVTKMQINYQNNLTIINKLRLDQHNFDLENNETTLNIHYKPVNFNVDFYGLGRKSIAGTDLQFRNEVHTTVGIELPHNFSFKYFTKNRVGPRAESEKKFIAQGMTFMYKGKCLEANLGIERKYAKRNDLKPTTEYELRFNVPLN